MEHHSETFKDNAARSMNSASTLNQPPTEANLPRHRHQEKLVSCTKLCSAVPRTPPARAQVPLSQQPRRTAAPFCGGVRRQQLARRAGGSSPGAAAAPGRAAHLLLPGSARAPAPAALRAPAAGATPFPGILPSPGSPAPLRAAASQMPRQHCGGTLPSRDKPPLRCLTADMQHYRPAFHLPRSAAAAARLSKWQLASPLCRRNHSLICPFLLRPPTGFLFIPRYSTA